MRDESGRYPLRLVTFAVSEGNNQPFSESDLTCKVPFRTRLHSASVHVNRSLLYHVVISETAVNSLLSLSLVFGTELLVRRLNSLLDFRRPMLGRVSEGRRG